MRILTIRTISGPNVISHNPVLVMRLDLEDFTGKERSGIPGFVDRLIAALPGIHEHVCGSGHTGGFIERVREGTHFGHIVEHVALELAGRAGISVSPGKIICAGAGRLDDVCVEYKNEAGMRRLLEIAVELVQCVVDGHDYALDSRMAEVLDLIRDTELGPSTRAIVEAAARRGIPVTRLSEDTLVQLGHGCRRKFIRAAMSSDTSVVAVDTAGDKSLTRAVLARAAVPAPAGRIVDSLEAAERAFEELGAPVVVKPLDGNQGKGVSLDLWTAEQVGYAFEIAQQLSRRVVIEKLLRGRDYRVLVIGGKMLAACERLPARVIGDGRRTLQELIDEANRDPRRGVGHSKPMSTIKIDRILVGSLTKQGYTLDSVPGEGAAVILRENVNLSTGGAAIDVTDRVHSSMRQICERAARSIGLDICGVDLVVPDISQPFTEGGVVEVNAAPGIRMHLFPSEGEPRDVGAEIVRMMYPEGDGRIPIVSITGTNGKTTVTRLIAHILGQFNPRIGMTTTEGIWIGGRQIAARDTTGPRSAATVLFDPEVEIAVLETARGGIVRNGLGYDWSDVGVMTNIQRDPVSQNGIETVEDILRIKSLVAERVREGGTVVLNADDELLRTIPERPEVKRLSKRFIWFAMNGSNVQLETARRAGGTVYYYEDGSIVEATGANLRRIMDVHLIPMTFGGASRFQVQNVMAAVAACRAMGAGVAQIRSGLRTFEAGEHNPARANLFAVAGRYVLVDYGHNSAAFETICDTARNWPTGDRVCVLGVPGDRADHIIREAGRSASRGFERIIVREDKDLRGRRPGEVPRLLVEGVRAARRDASIDLVRDEIEALDRALDKVAADGLVVAFCDNCESVREYLDSRGAAPASSFAAAGQQARVA